MADTIINGNTYKDLGNTDSAFPSPKTPPTPSNNIDNTGTALQNNTISPAIISSAAANTDLTKIKTDTADRNTAIQTQAQKVATAKATSDAATAAKAQTDAATKAASDKATADAAALAAKNAAVTGTTPAPPVIPTDTTFTNAINRATSEVTSVANNLDGTRTVTYKDGTTQSIAGDPNDPTQAKAATDNTIKTEGARVSQQILDIQNGVIPLSAGDQAQIAGLQKQFNDLIAQTTLQNTGATGLANVRGYQTGSAEYDPTFQVKTIGSIITAGANKISDLQVKEASAVATLTQALKNGEVNAIKDAYNIADKARQDTSKTLSETIKNTQDAIQKAKDAKIAADKVQYEEITKPIQDIAAEAAKNGADATTLSTINSSKDVNSAVTSAGQYLQTGTGQMGDYLQYKKDIIAKGLTPQDYTTWKKADDEQTRKNKAAEAYSTAYNTAKGKSAGTVPGTTVDENGNVVITGNLNALDIGRYNLAATRATKTFRDTQAFKAATNAGFYISKIDSAVKNTGSIGDQEILDAISQFNTGGGRVTEAQVGLILGGKSFSDTINAWTNKVKNGGILSDNQREQALKLATTTKDSFLKNYEEKYTPLSENLTKQGIPKEFWGIPSPEQLRGEGTPDAKTQVENYQQDNTISDTDAEASANRFNVPGWTDEKEVAYLKLNGKLK